MENTELNELEKKTLKSYVKKATTSSARHMAKSDKEEDNAMSTDGTKHPAKQQRHTDAAIKHYDKAQKRDKGIATAKKKLSESFDFKTFLLNILDGNFKDADATFEAIMQWKMEDVVEGQRQEIASMVFGRPVTENADLHELHKNTLRNYVDKAIADTKSKLATSDAEHASGKSGDSKKTFQKAFKRMASVKDAQKKIAES